MKSTPNGQSQEENSKKYAAVQPGSSVPYAEIDKIRAEIARDRDSDQNSEKIIRVFQGEIQKDYFAEKIASIVLKAKKIHRHDNTVNIGLEIIKFIAYTALGFALSKLLPVISARLGF